MSEMKNNILIELEENVKSNNIEGMTNCGNKLRVKIKELIINDELMIIKILRDILDLLKELPESHINFKIIKMVLLDPEWIELYILLIGNKNTIEIGLEILSYLCNNDINTKNFVLNRIIEKCEDIEKFIDKVEWSDNSFRYMIKICSTRMINFNNTIISDANILCLLMKCILYKDIDRFYDFICIMEEYIEFNNFNINILDSEYFSELLIDYLILYEKYKEKIISILLKFIQINISHSNFNKLYRFIYHNISISKDIILQLCTISQQNYNKQVNMWDFTNIHNNQYIMIIYNQDPCFDKGFSIFFDFVIFSTFTKSSLFPLLWMNSLNDIKSGFLLTLNVTKNSFYLFIITNSTPILSEIYNLNFCFDNINSIGLSLISNASSLDTNIIIKNSNGVEYSVKRFSIKTIELNNLQVIFGYYPYELINKESQNILENFVGRIGEINIINEYCNMEFVNKLKSDDLKNILMIKKYEKSNIISFNNNIENKLISFTVNGLYKYMNIHINNYIENYDNIYLWLCIVDKIINDINTGNNDIYDIIIDNILTTCLNLLKIYKVNIKSVEYELLFKHGVFVYFLYKKRNYKNLISNKFLEFLANNQSFEICLIDNNSRKCKLFLEILLNPYLWSSQNIDAQIVRMQILCSCLIDTITDNIPCTIPISLIIHYLILLKESNIIERYKNEIYLPVFKIFHHIIMSSIDENSLYILVEYFTFENCVKLNMLMFELIVKLIKLKLFSDREISILCIFINKYFVTNSHVIDISVLNFVINNISNYDKFNLLVSEKILLCWVCKICISSEFNCDCSCNLINELIHILGDSSKIDRNNLNICVKLLLYCLILISKINFKNRLIIITSLRNILEKDKSICKIVSENLPTPLFISPLWKCIPNSIYNILVKYIHNTDEMFKIDENVSKFNIEKIEDEYTLVTIMQQMALIFLALYKYSREALRFLLIPLYYGELHGVTTMFIENWHVKVIMLTIYLRAFLSIDLREHSSSSRSENNLEENIIVQLIEISCFILLETVTYLVGEISEDKFDIVEECIKILSELIVKNLSFSSHHLNLPLIIVLRYISLGSYEVKRVFCGLIESCMNIIDINIFHICSVISTLYKLIKVNDSSEIILYMEKIIKKYNKLFYRAGLCIKSIDKEVNNKCSSSESSSICSSNSNDINNLCINHNDGVLRLDKSIWDQILFISEEHPLIICWLSNPMYISGNIRKITLDLYANFVELIDSTCNIRVKLHDESEVNKIKYYNRMLNGIFKNYNEYKLIYNIKRYNILSVLFDDKNNSIILPYMKHLCNPKFSRISIENKNCSKMILMRNIIMNEFYSNLYLKNEYNNGKYIKKWDCKFVYLNYELNGIIRISCSNILFNETILISDRLLDDNEFNINLIFGIKNINFIYYCITLLCNKYIIEIFLKNGSCCRFILSSNDDFNDIVRTLMDYTDITLYNGNSSVDDIIKLSDEWKNKRIGNFGYLYILNILYNRTFHDISSSIIFPNFSKQIRVNQFNFTDIYGIFRSCYPIRDIGDSNMMVHSDGSNMMVRSDGSNIDDPYINIETFYEFFNKKLTCKNIVDFIDNQFGRIESNNDDESYNTSACSSEFKFLLHDEYNVINDDNLNVSSVRDKPQFKMIYKYDKISEEVIALSVCEMENSVYIMYILTKMYLYKYMINMKNSIISDILSYITGNVNISISLVYKYNISSHNIKNCHNITKQNVNFIVIVGFVDNCIILIYHQCNNIYSIMKFHQDFITSIDISVNIIVSGSNDGVLCVWNVDNNIPSYQTSIKYIYQPNNILYGHASSIVSIKIQSINQCIISLDSTYLLCIHLLDNSMLIFNKYLLNIFNTNSLCSELYLELSYPSYFYLINKTNNSSQITCFTPYGTIINSIEFDQYITFTSITDRFLIIILQYNHLQVYQHTNMLLIIDHVFQFNIYVIYYLIHTNRFICLSDNYQLLFLQFT